MAESKLRLIGALFEVESSGLVSSVSMMLSGHEQLVLQTHAAVGGLLAIVPWVCYAFGDRKFADVFDDAYC